MTRKKAPPAIHPLFRLAPGQMVTYWPLEGIAEDRAAIFKAARQARDEGHVDLHCKGDAYVARGRMR